MSPVSSPWAVNLKFNCSEIKSASSVTLHKQQFIQNARLSLEANAMPQKPVIDFNGYGEAKIIFMMMMLIIIRECLPGFSLKTQRSKHSSPEDRYTGYLPLLFDGLDQRKPWILWTSINNFFSGQIATKFFSVRKNWTKVNFHSNQL